ncbi:MAG: FprA family A-type flavoprotein [Bacteroidales bacterium]|jgi:flavorubredoxin|nr:FprA family A-type flavoprotein [Bacteroidales bacterium]
MDDKILDITTDVKWIGVLDKDIRTFDIVMETKYGATYNSYFINADKKTVVETCKEKFWDVYLEKLKKVVNPAEIEYIILNHTEPDHSGNALKLLNMAPNAKIVGTGNVIRYMNELGNCEFPHIVVKDGDILNLGNKTLRFIGAPNLHWPDSMYSYLEEDKVLFTCDSFGSHFCHEEMYDDKVGNFDDAFKYYFDVILKPFSKFMLKAIEKIRPLDIQAICTGHGPLLTKNWKRYVDLSEQYAKEAVSYPQKEKVFIAYVSAYQKSQLLAEAIAEGIKENGHVEIDLCDIEKMGPAEIDRKLTEASAFIIGSPTINQNTLLQIYTLFALINPIRDKGKLAGCFGSYGWSGEAQKIMESMLTNLKLNLMADNIFVKFTPSQEDIQRCIEYGKTFAAKMLEIKCGVQ